MKCDTGSVKKEKAYSSPRAEVARAQAGLKLATLATAIAGVVLLASTGEVPCIRDASFEKAQNVVHVVQGAGGGLLAQAASFLPVVLPQRSSVCLPSRKLLKRRSKHELGSPRPTGH